VVKNKLFSLLVILITLCVGEEQGLRNLRILKLVPLLISAVFRATLFSSSGGQLY